MKSLLMAAGGCRRLCRGFGIGSSPASLLQYTYKHHHLHHHHHILQARTNLNDTYSSLPLSNPNPNPQSSFSTLDSPFSPLLLLNQLQHQHHRCGLFHQSAAAAVGNGVGFGVEGGGALTHRLHYSSKSDSDSSSSSSLSSSNVDMKHQEIEGPTVERDVSPLANETREVSIGLMKTMYRLSNLLAILGISQLAVGSTFYFLHQSTPNTQIMILMMMMNNVVVGFALPFSVAFMLRHSLKSMHFFHKMEQLGRLQILTSTMQLSKHLHLFFSRFTSLTYLCLALLPLPLLLSFSSSSS